MLGHQIAESEFFKANNEATPGPLPSTFAWLKKKNLHA